MGAGADPDTASPDEQRSTESGKRKGGEDEGTQLARIVADIHGNVAFQPIEGDSAPAVRQIVGLARAQDNSALVAGTTVELGQVIGLKDIDAAGFAVVETEIAIVRVEVELGVERVRVAGEGDAVLADERRRKEESDKPQLVRRGVGRLDHHERSEKPILRDSHDRALHGNVPVAIAHSDYRCVPVAYQVDAGAADLQRRVHFQDLFDFLSVRAVLGGDVSGEVEGLPVMGFLPVKLHIEIVQSQRIRLKLASCEVRTRSESVVAHQCVDEAVTLHNDFLPAVPEQSSHCHRDEDSDQGEVEHEVSDFLEESAFCANRWLSGVAVA